MIKLVVGVVIGLITLTILVVVHELGHAVSAIKNGVKVEEFGVGFPPKILKKKLKNGINFSLNWLPLGGFVKMKGEYDSSDKPGDYGHASYWKKTKILLAGVSMNLLFAMILLTALAFVGMPKIIDNQFYISSDSKIISSNVTIGSVADGYPADEAGLKVNDEIIKIDDQTISSTEQVIEYTKSHLGQIIRLTYLRDSETKSVNITLRSSDDGGILGVGLGQDKTIKSTWSAPIVGIITTLQYTGETFKGVYDIFANLLSGIIGQFNSSSQIQQEARQDLAQVGDSVAGPIGILGSIFPAAEAGGIKQLTLLAAILSVSLAVMNILPIPALDGGRWLVMTIYKLRKKVLTKEREEKIQSIGFMVLMGLVLIVTFSDVVRIFK